MSLDDASRAQRRAARPHVSTWLVANAGSGKTKVLTERVARLLLAGVQPQRILCLTYTKAAASEMQNRLFKTLGAWTMLPRGKLAEALAGLGEPGPFEDEVLEQARTLFARAVETPGGLKIQTIHSFCATVLRRFPLEAGVSPDFKEMDDRLAKLLQREVVEELALTSDPGIAALAKHHTDDDLGRLLGQIIRQKQALLHPKTREEVFAAFDVSPSLTLADLAAPILTDDHADLAQSVGTALQNSSTRDKDYGRRLLDVDFHGPVETGLLQLEAVLLNGKGQPRGTWFPSKTAREGIIAEYTAAYDDLSEMVAAAREARLALKAAEKTAALNLFAGAFLQAYERKKAQGGWLDFDDLINLTRTLLQDSATAAWVLYKLDGGIDHILVDEAQDTSPEQWDVIRTLAEEFLSGQGAREEQRTIFVVGDKKQSIYMFQGADPGAFDGMRAHFETMLAEAPDPLQDEELSYSFRSSPAILGVVDKVFALTGHAGLGQESHHKAFKEALPGRVDLLDPIEPVQPEKGVWYEAVDRLGEADHRRQMAENIASRIKAMIGTESIPIVDRDGRRDKVVEPKDILILVQRRSEIFNEIIRACKARGIPMAGADQLNVAQELAVRDITAVLSFLATPEDDLSLAAALKSPLFGWGEEPLFDLAYNRTGSYLWQGLREREADFPETVRILRDLRNNTDFLRPYELIERLLTTHDGRHRIRARLGAEADDAIDALLAQALAYEQSETPSLTGFLTWLGADDLRIKRAIDSAANVVRVMTVHGAKGLEAPIVILPDTAYRSKPTSDAVAVAGDLAVWRVSKGDMPPDHLADLEAEQARLEEERQRLLYVAMTRAECWLIVAAAGKLEASSSGSWYTQISDALAKLETVPIDGGRRFEPLPWPEPVTEGTAAAGETLMRLVLPPVESPQVSTPIAATDLGGAKTMPGSDEDSDALDRGTAIHSLLEHLPALPRETWQRYATEIGAGHVFEEARKVLDAPELAPVFAPGTLTEVPITAELAELGGRRLRGTIDRLIVTGDSVLAVDFKSNRLEPTRAEEVPEGLLRQMGAYAAALAQVYPGKQIETAILWTASATLMPLTHPSVMEALQRSAKA